MSLELASTLKILSCLIINYNIDVQSSRTRNKPTHRYIYLVSFWNVPRVFLNPGSIRENWLGSHFEFNWCPGYCNLNKIHYCKTLNLNFFICGMDIMSIAYNFQFNWINVSLAQKCKHYARHKVCKDKNDDIVPIVEKVIIW